MYYRVCGRHVENACNWHQERVFPISSEYTFLHKTGTRVALFLQNASVNKFNLEDVLSFF